MNAIKATGSAGKEYGHVPGHQYHDVDVTISRTRKGNWTVEILETWGSAQGYDEEHGRKKVIGRSEDLRSAVSDARQRAKNADIGPDYVEESLSEAEQNATEEIEAAEETVDSQESRMIRLVDVMMEVVAGNISTGKARETLREEKYPAAVWQKVLAPLAE